MAVVAGCTRVYEKHVTQGNVKRDKERKTRDAGWRRR
jgi:hypothetical protein